MKKQISLLLLLCGPLLLAASSTSGSTYRNLGIDGLVVTGASPGANLVAWETDERLTGAGAALDWYMSWDETNLYLGRAGGNNGTRSVIYLHAGFATASYTNQGFSFTQYQPDLANLGGVNFALSIDSLNHQLSTWNGSAWTVSASPLVPQFSIQSTVHQMEVAIPWNLITGGNGLPSEFRAVFCQVIDPANAACPGGGPLVYGESPWGTGIGPNGPNIAVNDGSSNSALQPTGCDVGDSTITRWWGCYPLWGGIGPNTWDPQVSFAGVDTSICQSATAYLLQADPPTAPAFGSWGVISQPGGSPAVTFANPNDPATVVQNLLGLGDYELVWVVNFAGCATFRDTVVITRVGLPPAAMAGTDQDLACGLDFATLNGNDPGVNGHGTWSLISGSGAILLPDSFNTSISALAYGPNVFQWTIENGPCPVDTDQVTIWSYQQTFALAGVDQELCGLSSTSLSGIDPILFGGQPLGTWSQVSGPSSLVFFDANTFNTNLSNLQPGTYELAWTLVNGTCPVSEDTVDLLIHAIPSANAGPNQNLCLGDMLQLDGNDVSTLGPSAAGHWVQTSGPSTAAFQDSSLYNSLVSDLETGVYKFFWIVENGNCIPESDAVIYTVIALQTNGLEDSQDATEGASDGWAIIAEPLNGIPPFHYSLDSLDFSLDSAFYNLEAGNYTSWIRDDNGCINSFEFELKETNVTQPGDSSGIVVPTGFSPNGDGVNDSWLLKNVENFPDVLVEVYNIWGKKVYESRGYPLPWDGSYKGAKLPAATYYFVVVPNANGANVEKGSLTIFR